MDNLFPGIPTPVALIILAGILIWALGKRKKSVKKLRDESERLDYEVDIARKKAELAKYKGGKGENKWLK